MKLEQKDGFYTWSARCGAYGTSEYSAAAAAMDAQMHAQGCFVCRFGPDDPEGVFGEDVHE